MALTFSEKFRAGIGGKAFRAYEVTHDGSETSIDASDLDMNYIDAAMAGPGTQVLSATSVAYADLTTTSGNSIAFTALSAGATSIIWAFGS